MTRAIIVAVLLMALLLSGRAEAGIMLTGASEFSTNSSGSAQSPNIWNTQGGDPYYNLYFTAPNAGLSGAFLNSGNDASTAINYSLTAGTYQFFIFANPGLASSYEAMNLFFDGGATPTISVYAPLATTTVAPTFSANSNSHTLGLDGVSVVGGSGTLSASLDGFNIALTGYSWSAPSVLNLDRVGQFATGADGMSDFVGSITFTVTAASVPEPSSLMMLAIGVSGAVWTIRHRSRGESGIPTTEAF